MDIRIDIWYNGPRGAEAFYYPLSVREGRSIMKKFHKEGKEAVRMYIRDADGNTSRNRYYYFEGDKIKIERDDYNN